MSGYTKAGGGGGGGNVVIYDSGGTAISEGIPADAIVSATVNALDTRSFVHAFNGLTLERLRTFASFDVAGLTNQGILAAGVMLLDGSGQIVRALTASNAGDAAASGLQAAGLWIWNGTTFDRARSAAAATATTGTGLLGMGLLAYDGAANFVRVTETGTNSDGVGNNTPNSLDVSARLNVYNGTSWDRLRSNSAATLSGATQSRGLLSSAPGQWSIISTPAVSTQATATKAAGGAAVRHVCNTISFSHDAIAAQVAVQLNVRDGGTGAGTIIWSMTLKLAVGQQPLCVTLSGLQIFGTANTAMTAEFSAAPVALNTQSLTATGYSTT